jgi:peptidylprolyl isomerase
VTLALVALAALGLASCGEAPREERAPSEPSAVAPEAQARPPAEWSLAALPRAEVLREHDTPGGARAQVLREGVGEPLAKGQAMDLQVHGLRLDGTTFVRETRLGVVLEQGRLPPGLAEGVEGIRLRETRRVLVPAALAGGAEDAVFVARRVALGIEDLQVGTGREVRRGTQVVCHYRGRLEDGTPFDSSHERGEPFTVRLPADPRAPAGVIEGWARGLLGMRAGGVRRLWIPWHLAYGERPKGKIPAYSDLDFTIEVLRVDDL